VEPLPTSPPALPPRKPKPSNSLIPKIDPPKEFQNFLENIGSSFNFAARSEKQSPAQVCKKSILKTCALILASRHRKQKNRQTDK
jgi:hypothetical protein